MARRLVVDLLNVLAQIGVDHADAPLFQVLVQATLFGEHGLTFHHLP